jgi:hypothetical protein
LFPQKFDSVVSNAASTGAKIGLLDSTQSNIYNESKPAHHKIIVHLRGCDTSNSRQDSLLMASTPQVESHLTPHSLYGQASFYNLAETSHLGET